jgi:hypothetical protein
MKIGIRFGEVSDQRPIRRQIVPMLVTVKWFRVGNSAAEFPPIDAAKASSKTLPLRFDELMTGERTAPRKFVSLQREGYSEAIRNTSDCSSDVRFE